MRVLVLTNMYPPHHYGGYELSCRDCVDRWRAAGHDVTVLTSTMRVPGVAHPTASEDEGVRRDLRLYFDDGDLHVPSEPVRVLWERRNRRALAAALRDVRPDVVSVWHMGALSTGLLAQLADTGLPLVYSVCDDWLSYCVAVDGWMRLWPDRPRLARVAGVVTGLPTALPDVGATGTFCFVSDVTRARSEELSPWTFPDATVVYSGIDRRDFPPIDAPPAARPWRWRLLYVGRVDDRKGIDTAIRALPLLPASATLLVVGKGHGPTLDALRALGAELGVADRVTFVDGVDRAALRDVYAGADVCVFPSEWVEPFGLVPVEAMACDTPVVATATGGSGEFLVDGANSVRFAAGDPGGLAAAVSRLAEDPALRQRLVLGGRATADDLTVDRLAQVLLAWHEAAARRFADGRPPHRPKPLAVVP